MPKSQELRSVSEEKKYLCLFLIIFLFSQASVEFSFDNDFVGGTEFESHLTLDYIANQIYESRYKNNYKNWAEATHFLDISVPEISNKKQVTRDDWGKKKAIEFEKIIIEFSKTRKEQCLDRIDRW